MPLHRVLPLIDPARCTGCGRCIAVCPEHVLAFRTQAWTKAAELADAPGCTGCGQCAPVCPFNAISWQRRDGATPPGAGCAS